MPYKSDAQRRMFHAMLKRGEIDAKTVAEYDKESKGKDLPEKASKLSDYLKKNKKKKGKK
jgi:hypothetical protein